MQFTRYAVYVMPPPGPLADFGASWLGWDAARGVPVAHPQMSGLPAPVEEITETPRKYGLHGTMKPPFRLAHGQSGAALEAAFAGFCAHAAPVTLDGLRIAPLGRFLALVCDGEQTALNALAAGTVRALDPLRAPLGEHELARRRAASLTLDQDALLRRWGYPYVMDAFRFHITLTGKRPRAELPVIAAALAPQLEPLLPRPFGIDALSLVGEDATGRFHLIHRHTLAA